MSQTPLFIATRIKVKITEIVKPDKEKSEIVKIDSSSAN